MEVKVVSITEPLITIISEYGGQPDRKLTPEELIVYVARVSNPSNQLNTATADRLLAFLIKQKHWSPFDMVNLCVEVKTSRAVAHQILRHWSIKPQEFSQRYAEVTEFEEIELRRQAETNRQSSTEVFDPEITIGLESDDETIFHPVIREGWKASQVLAELLELEKQIYQSLLRANVAKESARLMLPLRTSTTMYLNGSIRSWIHYLEQRTHEHTQLEHRKVAIEIREIFGKYFPNVLKAAENHD